MGRRPVVDWEFHCRNFEKMKAAEPGLTRVAYSRRKGLAGETFRKKYAAWKKAGNGIDTVPGPKGNGKTTGRKKRPVGKKTGKKPARKHKHDWKALKIEFLGGAFDTLEEFAGHKGLNAGDGNFIRKTRGWLKEKDAMRMRAEKAAIQRLDELSIESAYREMTAGILNVMQFMDDAAGLRERVRDSIDTDPDPLKLKFFVGSGREILDTYKEIEPFMKKLMGTSAAIHIWENLAAGRIDVKDAAYSFERLGLELPRSLRIELAKIPPPQEKPAVVNRFSREELEARYQESMRGIDDQKEKFLPMRRKKVETLKEEHKDSFSIEAIDKPGAHG